MECVMLCSHQAYSSLFLRAMLFTFSICFCQNVLVVSFFGLCLCSFLARGLMTGNGSLAGAVMAGGGNAGVVLPPSSRGEGDTGAESEGIEVVF